MEGERVPALFPALGLLAGLALSTTLGWLPVGLAAALAGLGLALGPGWGRAVMALGLGLWLGTVEGLGPPAGPLPSATVPVAARGEVRSHWQCLAEGCSASFELSALCQRGAPAQFPPRVQLRVYNRQSWELPPPGTVLRVQGYLHASFAPRNGGGPGPPRWALSVKSPRLVEVTEAAGPLGRYAGAARRRLERALAGQPATPGTALARGLLLGDLGSLPAAWLRGLKRTGLYHLLAVSGFHLALFAGVTWMATSWVRRLGLRLALEVLVVAAYLALVGPLPSLLRAAAMAALAVLALVLSRPFHSLNALAASAALLALATPALVAEVGFQLSCLATLGLLRLAPALAARWTLRPHWLRRLLAASLGAELATLPITLPSFHLLPLAGPLLNLFFIPWAALALFVSLAWLAVALLAPGLASAALPVLDLVALPFAALARVPAEVPLAVPLVAGPGSACLLAVLLGWMAARPGVRLWGLLASLPFWLGPLPSGPGRLELVMLDVAQGDAILLKDGRYGLLVDGGGWRRGDLGGSVLLPALLRQGLIGLEGAVLSHGDQDHCGGLLDLGSYLPLGTLWVGPDGSGAAAPAGGGCRHELLAAGGPTATLVAGERLRWRSWSFEVLSPEAATRAAGNDASLVLQARAADGLTVLLTGDIGAEVEARLLARFGPRLRAGVLKVAHHGSRFSSSPRFLAAVAPRLALISVGAGNLYGHPAASTLERLRSAGAQAWRTDVSGGARVRLGPSGRLEIRALEP